MVLGSQIFVLPKVIFKEHTRSSAGRWSLVISCVFALRKISVICQLMAILGRQQAPGPFIFDCLARPLHDCIEDAFILKEDILKPPFKGETEFFSRYSSYFIVCWNTDGKAIPFDG